MNYAMRLLPILVTTYGLLASAYEKKQQRGRLTKANIQNLNRIAVEIQETLGMMLDDPEIVHYREVFRSQEELFKSARDGFAYYLSLSRRV